MQNNVLCDRPELMIFFRVLTSEEHHRHEYTHITYLKKYAQHSKAIRIAGCLAKVSVLAAVPVHQMKLQSKWYESVPVDHRH
jgi:hypothetical protein